jgi:4a-hydroxytetrahydrobiopterin dehydratase
MSKLDAGQIDQFLSSHDGWRRDGDSLIRTFEFADFTQAMGFVTRVALVAEKAFHHPDIDIRWNQVTLRLSTHSEGGLTDKDTDLADTLDGFVD